MEEKIYDELKQIRRLLSQLIGTSDLPTSERFSKEAISRAAKEFQKLTIERGEWIPDNEIDKIIRTAHYCPGKFLIERMGFTNYFKWGREHYFNKKDLQALNKELKERKIHLDKYHTLFFEKERFDNLVRGIKIPKGTKTKKHYKIPEGLQNITDRPYSQETEELARKEIETLMEEYKKFDLSEYIELYFGKTQAYYRYEYSFDRYIKPELKKYCKDWCFKFNYANTALKTMMEIKKEYDSF
jgi:Ca2+-binding EF-hand superfamily protein